MDIEDIFDNIIENWELYLISLSICLFVAWMIITSFNSSSTNIQTGTQLIESEAIPFWIYPFILLKDSNNPLAALFIFVFLILIVRYYKKKGSK